jgi:hypothetical protein
LQSFATSYGVQLKQKEEEKHALSCDYRSAQEHAWRGWYWQIGSAALVGLVVVGGVGKIVEAASDLSIDHPSILGSVLGALVGVGIKLTQDYHRRKLRSRLELPEEEAQQRIDHGYMARANQLVLSYQQKRDEDARRRTELHPLEYFLGEENSVTGRTSSSPQPCNLLLLRK